MIRTRKKTAIVDPNSKTMVKNNEHKYYYHQPNEYIMREIEKEKF